MLKVPIVNLGHTGLKVSRLGFGTFDFGVPSHKIRAGKEGKSCLNRIS